MVNHLLVSWYKFDDYYKLTDDAPVYATALLLHPSLREHYLRNNWTHQKQYINPAIQAARKLWEAYKPSNVVDQDILNAEENGWAQDAARNSRLQ